MVDASASAMHVRSKAPPSTFDARSTKTTKCLSAAAYTDARFRRRVLALTTDPLRARAPELGLDVAAVVHHCGIAQARDLIRDTLFLVPLAWFLLRVIAGSARDGDDLSDTLQDYGIEIVLIVFFSVIVAFAFRYMTEEVTLTRTFSGGAVKEQFAPPTGNAGNAIIYGAFSPFVGSGIDVGGYSFTVNLEQGKAYAEPHSRTPFTLTEMYAHLKKSFERLAIDGLRIEENLFVDGQAIREDPLFLPSATQVPRTEIESQYIDFFRKHPTRAVRYYLTVRIVDWSGETVTSMFVRFVKSESKLFVENSIFLLPPLKKEYYAIDRISRREPFRRVLRIAGKSLLTGPILAVLSPFMLMSRVSESCNSWGAARHQRREALNDMGFNYGALQSVREIGMENRWRVYFQKLDNQMNSKIVQHQFIDSIVKFLDDRGYETADIKDRGNHIFNNGVMISGGTIQAESLAVGQGAQANKRHEQTK